MPDDRAWMRREGKFTRLFARYIDKPGEVCRDADDGTDRAGGAMEFKRRLSWKLLCDSEESSVGRQKLVED
ncbi:MAG: hypothetical protein ABI277_09705 [Burkholderiaceae bacterium]